MTYTSGERLGNEKLVKENTVFPRKVRLRLVRPTGEHPLHVIGKYVDIVLIEHVDPAR
jgi:hypothetical protein